VTNPFTKPVEDTVARVDHEVAVGEDLRFQRSWWRFEKGVWVFFVLVIALDLAGVFGRGPLAKAELQSPDRAVGIRYERIERSGTSSMLTIELGPKAMVDGATHLFVSDSVVGSLGARRVIPEPSSTEIGHGGLTYTFPASRPPASIRLELEPADAGVFSFEIAVPGVDALRAKILVMP
jgi:hypothetical protein